MSGTINMPGGDVCQYQESPCISNIATRRTVSRVLQIAISGTTMHTKLYACPSSHSVSQIQLIDFSKSRYATAFDFHRILFHIRAFKFHSFMLQQYKAN